VNRKKETPRARASIYGPRNQRNQRKVGVQFYRNMYPLKLKVGIRTRGC